MTPFGRAEAALRRLNQAVHEHGRKPADPITACLAVRAEEQAALLARLTGAPAEEPRPSAVVLEAQRAALQHAAELATSRLSQ